MDKKLSEISHQNSKEAKNTLPYQYCRACSWYGYLHINYSLLSTPILFRFDSSCVLNLNKYLHKPQISTEI